MIIILYMMRLWMQRVTCMEEMIELSKFIKSWLSVVVCLLSNLLLALISPLMWHGFNKKIFKFKF
jgi:hypothetical protein